MCGANPGMHKGVIHYPDGSTYSGQLLNNQRSGHGVLTTNAVKYEGDFVSDQFDGSGVLITQDFAYRGHFRGGVPHGAGVLTPKRPIYEELRLLEGNVVKQISGDFDGGRASGRFEVVTECFVFTGLLRDGCYVRGKLFLVGESARLVERDCERGLECRVAFEDKRIQCTYECAGACFSGYLDYRLRKCYQCVYRARGCAFDGLMHEDAFLQGTARYGVPPRGEIDFELLDEQQLEINQVLRDLSAYFDVADGIVITPHIFRVSGDLDLQIASFTGKFAGNECREGQFSFSNGCSLKGVRSGGAFSGEFTFRNAQYTGAVAGQQFAGRASIVIAHALYGRMRVECEFERGRLVNQLQIATDSTQITTRLSAGGEVLSVAYCEQELFTASADRRGGRFLLQYGKIRYERDAAHSDEKLCVGDDAYRVRRDSASGRISAIESADGRFRAAGNNIQTPAYRFTGKTANLAPAGDGVYEDDKMVVAGAFDGRGFSGRCRYRFKFPADHFRDGLPVCEMTVAAAGARCSGHCIIQYEHSTFAGQLLDGAKKSGIWQFPSVRFEGLFDGNLFAKGTITLASGECTRGEFSRGEEYSWDFVPFKLRAVGQVESRADGFVLVQEDKLVRIQGADYAYVGGYENGQYQGSGVLETPQCRYEGQFREGAFHGRGIYYDKATGDEYSGAFDGGRFTGAFTIRYANGDTFEGALRDRLKSGPGTLVTQDYTYEGGFQNDEFHGRGTQTFGDGTVYAGDYQQGFKQGEGRFQTKQLIYEGQFAGDVFSGRGKLYYLGAGITVDQIECCQVQTGEFRGNQLVSGKLEAAEYQMEGQFSDQQLLNGRYVGNFSRSHLRKFTWLGSVIADRIVQLEGDFKCEAIGFKAESCVYGEIRRGEQQCYSADFRDEKGAVYQLKCCADGSIDENRVQSIEFSSEEAYKGYLSQELKFVKYGQYQCAGRYFEGVFSNSLPSQGRLRSKEYEFEGAVDGWRPKRGKLRLHGLAYAVTAQFDAACDPVGLARVEFDNGSVYEGLWRRGVFYGSGLLDGDAIMYDLEEYQPERGELLDRCKIIYAKAATGDSYTGTVKDGRYNGPGQLKVNGESYSGAFRDGLKDGPFETVERVDLTAFSQIIQNFAKFFSFTFDKSVFTGQGTYAEDKKIGQWQYSGGAELLFDYEAHKFSLSSGDGKITYDPENIEITQGYCYYRGNRQYHGTLRLQDLRYEGLVIDSQFEAQGKLRYHGGSYSGGFLHSKQCGDGKLQTAEYVYCGQFRDGQIRGLGVMKMQNGDIYQGAFENGVFARGKILYADGRVFEGEAL